ncbi:MAG: Hsp70 family protein [Cyanobacteria bacterium P01_E01_bin.42]
MAIAIDFGTSNTVITRWNAAKDQAETLKFPALSQQLGKNPPLIPSLVYVNNAVEEEILIGQQVRDRGLDLASDPRFFRSFKRGIGTEIQGFLPTLDAKTVTFEQVGTWFLQTLLQQIDAEEALDSLILTVPVDSFESYRNWLTRICQSLKADNVRILDEPTAAALGYGAEAGGILLVVDFGGGTLDLSLVQLNARGNSSSQKPMGFILKWGDKFLGESSKQKVKTAKVLAKAGDNLGGSDIDRWLADYFAEEQGLPKSSLILRLAERVKIALSSQPTASEVYFNDETLETYELKLDRDRFQTILAERDLFAKLDEMMAGVLQRGRLQGIEKNDIDAVLLVGGTTQIPAIQDWIANYFPSEKIKSDRPFDAIASGALQLSRGFKVKDFLYHSYGIRYWNRRNKCHDWHPLIPAGQPYPTPEPVELFLGASIDNQPSIELIIGELGEAEARTEVYFDGDSLVTRTLDSPDKPIVKPLNDRAGARSIAELSPLGKPGSDRIKVQFTVDEQRLLRITVEDLLRDCVLLENRAVVQLS